MHLGIIYAALLRANKMTLEVQKKYDLIYADPAWTFKVWSEKGKGRSAERHYKTISKEDIQNLPVSDWCNDDAVLFLWVTAPCLEEGMELIQKWGFTYKTVGFTWVKRNKKSPGWFFGMGYYTRANAEFCLLATKGKPLKRFSRSVRQIVDEPVREHSRKPDCVRERIVKLFGDRTRLEMFARTKTTGWDVFGDETDKYNT